VVGLRLTRELSPAKGSSEQPAKALLLVRVDREAANMKTMDSIAWLVRLGQKFLECRQKQGRDNF